MLFAEDAGDSFASEPLRDLARLVAVWDSKVFPANTYR
jgi:hypothetical protein